MRLEKTVQGQVSREEFERYRREAKALRLSLSAYVRCVMKMGSPKFRELAEHERVLLAEMKH